jgi:hypothetical protein
VLQSILATARDWSVILLALEAFLASLVPLFILFKLVQWLGRLLSKVVPVLRQAQQYILKAKHYIERAMELIAAPFIWVNSVAVGIKEGAASVRRLLAKGR